MNNPDIPRHIAIIMDGNGRWAQRRGRPRSFGHRAGGKAARTIIRAVWDAGVPELTLFAFSTENWQRPEQEVGLLMDLFRRSLARGAGELHETDVRSRFIGDSSRFEPRMREEMDGAQRATAGNRGLRLNVAISYGGRQDLVRAAQRVAARVSRGEIGAAAIDESLLASELALADGPAPDLFIRTGGESRISNFLLWELAYTELWFTDVLWPEFSPAQLQEALSWYAGRERRYGQVSAQQARSHA